MGDHSHTNQAGELLDMTKDNRPPFLDVAKRALAKYYPGALGGFVAGSIIRGEGTPTSDIDIAVLFDETFEDVHRNTVLEEDWLIEFFVHNPKAQDFYFDKDRQRGMCVMPQMVAEGIVIPGDHPLLEIQKERARGIIAAGPLPLSDVQSDLMRYTVSALVDDLEGVTDQAVINAVLALLHDKLGDFHLRAAGKWSGFGKSLLRCLRAQDAVFAEAFERAFAAGFSGDGTHEIAALAARVIAPFGGRLQEGYRSAAPDTWKAFKD